MDRRSFLKGASLNAFTSIANTAQTPAPDLRIAYGGIGIECSTYSRLRTRIDEFTILRGAELASSARFQFLKSYPVAFMPALVATAVPGGPVERKTYDTIKAEFLQRLQALLPLNGLYLPMHGAMFVEGMQDAEADWYDAARKVVGPDCLLSASYDLHGNISQPVIDTLDMLSAFRTAPHIDREETMLRATGMLLHCLREKIRPTLMWAPIPVLLPGERTSTEWEPGKRLWAQLPALNREPGILDVSMLVGYVWADEPRSTAAVVITGTAPASQRRLAANLARQYWAARAEFKFGTETCTVDDCVQRAIEAATQPAILADSGDNPTGGGNGDQATVLESLLRHKARTSCSPASPIVPQRRHATRPALAPASPSPLERRSTPGPAGRSGRKAWSGFCLRNRIRPAAKLWCRSRGSRWCWLPTAAPTTTSPTSRVSDWTRSRSRSSP